MNRLKALKEHIHADDGQGFSEVAAVFQESMPSIYEQRATKIERVHLKVVWLCAFRLRGREGWCDGTLVVWHVVVWHVVVSLVWHVVVWDVRITGTKINIRMSVVSKL